MNSTDRSAAYGLSGNEVPRAGLHEETLKTEKIQIERKFFVFTLKENPRGRFLRISEEVNGRRDTIIIPAPGLEEFKRVINDMAKVSEATPLKVQQP